LAPERRRGGRKSRGGTAVLDEPISNAEGKTPTRREATIILIHPPDMPIGRRTQLDRDRMSIGRDSAADIALERDAVSRQHAELVRTGEDCWSVRDLGSTNGTFVNERPVEAGPEGESLRNGDQLRFGDVVFKYLSGGNVESLYHQEVYTLSVQDSMTGVHNKRYFTDFLERELASAHRHKNPLTLVMMDIDHFKQLNDERGHLCGDAVLKQLAARMRASARASGARTCSRATAARSSPPSSPSPASRAACASPRTSARWWRAGPSPSRRRSCRSP
jgi:pSer/pThr/pTyr-binding forkhead associated (FHA) protein